MKRTPATLLAVAAVGLVGTAFGASATAAAPQHLAVPVDRQAYVTSFTVTNPVDGSIVDPYNDDPSAIHVGVTGGQESARSFVHLAMEYLPTGADASEAVLTLHVPQKADTSNTGTYPIYNVNNTAAIVEACALVTEMPAKIDPEKPPAYDCAHGSSVGKHNAAGTTWTFALHNLLDYWAQHGNTGAALVPLAPDPSSTWAVSYSISQSTAQVTYAVKAVTQHHPRHHNGSGSGSGSTGGGSTGGQPPSSTDGGSTVVPPATGSDLPPTTTTGPDATGSTGTVTPPAVAGSGSGTTPPATTPVAKTDNGSPAWPWVLLVSVLVAVGAIGVAHRAALLAFAQRIIPPGVAAIRTHPRAYAVASAALAWGLVFTSYSLVTSSPATPQQELAGAQTPGAVPTTGVTPPSPGTPGSGPAVGQPGSGGSTGGSTVVPGSTGTGTPTGAPVTQQQQNDVAAHEFDGPGVFRTINGVQVFFPKDGSPPVAKLYTGTDDSIGLSPNQIRICAHAALTYGAAFNISDKDLDVFWQSVNDSGGIFGRKVATNYQNDNYDPGTAVQAAQACKDWGTFILEGGIGFDQIPAVRQWAEQNHVLYMHHIATSQGAAGLRYSFSALPTVEQVGTWMAQLSAAKLKGKKVGIIYRQSSNWDPGITAFEKAAKTLGITIVDALGTTLNQGNYTQELTRTKGAQVVLAWENALAEIEMLKQAQAQNWHPAWLVNGFNIITNTLGNTALDQDMWSAAEWDSYDPGYYGGGFSSYAAEIKLFEAQYKKYDSGANLKGPGGDLLFLNWEAQKGMADLLTACGPTCTRNKIAGLLLAGWHKVTPPNCPADFGRTSDHHHGGYLFNVLHAVRDPNGRANFVPVQRCVPGL